MNTEGTTVRLHLLLAFMSAGLIACTGVEGAVRGWVARAPGPVASWVEALVLVFLGMTIAGGLGLLASGHRPHEGLHLLYAVLVFAAVPVAGRLSSQAGPRTRGLVTALAAVFALVLVARLFATG